MTHTSIFFDAPVNPDALTAFVREVPMAADLRLSRLFPTRTTDDNTVDFAEIVHTNRTAKFRAYDGSIATMGRDSATESRVKLLPLSNSTNLGEYERLQLAFARTGGSNVAAMQRAIYNDAENLVASVRNRLEMAWGDVLTDGKLTINENGYQGEADFGVPTDHFVNAGTSWATIATATPLTELVTWTDKYNTDNGEMPGQIVTSLKVLRLMQTNKEIIDAVYGASAGKTRVTRVELNDLLTSEGLPNVALPYDLQLDVDGTGTRVLADDKLLLLPSDLGRLGGTYYGVSATALELVGSNLAELSFADAPGIVGVVIKEGPPFRQFTFVDAVAMPILAYPKRLFVADVVA